MNRAFLFFISIFVLITSAWAGGGPYFQRGNKGQVKLVDSCRLIEARFQEVNAWTQVVEGKSCSTVPPVREDGEGMCQMNVHSCLPEHVQKYQGLSSEVGGPNCWNLALVMGKVVPFMRQSSDEEWDFFFVHHCVVNCSQERKNSQVILVLSKSGLPRGVLGMSMALSMFQIPWSTQKMVY